MTTTMTMTRRRRRRVTQRPLQEVGAVLRRPRRQSASAVGWAALALRVGATFAPGPALGAAVWAALADDVDAAIQASNGVPRALRPFMYSFLASDPALYASAAALAAAPGLATSASPRAYFDAKTPAEVLGWLRPCPNARLPYSSPAYDKLQADIAQLAAATTKDEVERRTKARAALTDKFAAEDSMPTKQQIILMH